MVVLSQQVKSRFINSYALIAVESGLKCLLIVQFRFCGHGKPWYRERWFPPLQKAQGRGTLSDGGARKIKGGPPAFQGGGGWQLHRELDRAVTQGR
jgi:hypothetical protein